MFVYIRKLSCVLLAGLALPAFAGAPLKGDHFELVETKTDVYTNVTVMSATPELLSFSHSRGIGMVKVADLSDAEQIKLGFKEPPKPPVDVRAEVNKAMARIDLTPLEPLQTAWQETVAQGFRENTPARNMILGIFGGLFVVYILFCFCSKLICEKTGNKAGFLVWLPILQWIPLLKAANMSPGWVVIGLIPGLNIIAYLTWAVKITKARAKSGVIAFLLWLPVIQIFAFLYLALSSAAEAPQSTKGKSSSGRMARPDGLEPAWYDGTA